MLIIYLLLRASLIIRLFFRWLNQRCGYEMVATLYKSVSLLLRCDRKSCLTQPIFKNIKADFRQPKSATENLLFIAPQKGLMFSMCKRRKFWALVHGYTHNI